MEKIFGFFGRSTPFIFSVGLLGGPAFGQSRGHWQFDTDGTGLELSSCEAGAAAPCGLALFGDLQPEKAKDGELARLDGRAIDIDSMTPDGKAPRYAASFVVLSETRARLDVRGAFGTVSDRLQLRRALTPVNDCK